MGVGQRVHDSHAAADRVFVEPLEAALHHLRRRAVAEAARTAKPIAGGVAEKRRVERRNEERGAVEMVGRGHLELAIQVGPIRRQAVEGGAPMCGKRVLRRGGCVRCAFAPDELDRAFDAFGVESAQKSPDRFGSHTGAAARAEETNDASGAPRHRWCKQLRCALCACLVVDGQLEARIAPTRIQTAFDVGPLLGELHGPESRLSRVARVEKKTKATLSKSDLRDCFREMLLIRRFEEKVEERFRAGDLPGFLHVAIGQEAVAVGVCRALEDGDVIASTHRAHGHALAKGTHPNEVMAELYGKVEGCSHGYGGSMHLYDVERGNLGANAVVGGGLPQISGAALAFKLRGEPRVALAFFGDGATNIGTFHEALNLAQLWEVPAVFVLEDNHWAESSPESQHSPIRDLSKRAEAFGMKALKVDGQDVEAVFKTARRALEHARSGDGPVFVHVDTYRLSGHYIGDPQVYRPKGELEELRATKDPITLLRDRLGLSEDDVDEIDTEVREIVDASVEFAMAGTDPKPEDALKNVYV